MNEERIRPKGGPENGDDVLNARMRNQWNF